MRMLHEILLRIICSSRSSDMFTSMGSVNLNLRLICGGDHAPVTLLTMKNAFALFSKVYFALFHLSSNGSWHNRSLLEDWSYWHHEWNCLKMENRYLIFFKHLYYVRKKQSRCTCCKHNKLQTRKIRVPGYKLMTFYIFWEES